MLKLKDEEINILRVRNNQFEKEHSFKMSPGKRNPSLVNRFFLIIKKKNLKIMEKTIILNFFFI